MLTLFLLITLVLTCTVQSFQVKTYNGLGRSNQQSAAIFGTRPSNSVNYNKNRAPRRPPSRSPSTSSPSNELRKLKYARILRDELTDIICTSDIRAVTFPAEGLLDTVSIAEIELSNDFQRAKVYISSLGNTVERKQLFVWLNNHAGLVRHSLSQRLRSMKSVPTLTFALVDRQASNMLNQVMDEIAAEQPSSIPFDEVDFEEL